MPIPERATEYLSGLVEKAKAGKGMKAVEIKELKTELEQADKNDQRLGVLRLMEKGLLKPLAVLEKATQRVPEQPLIRNRVIDTRSDIQKDTHSLTEQVSGKTSPALTLAKEALRDLQQEAGKIIAELFKEQKDVVGMIGPTRVLIKQAEGAFQNLESGLTAEKMTKKTQRSPTVEEDHGLVFADAAPAAPQAESPRIELEDNGPESVFLEEAPASAPAPKKKPGTGRVNRSDLDDMFNRAKNAA